MSAAIRLVRVPDALEYASEKFAVAVSGMARSDAPLRQRVLDAYTEFNPVGLDVEGVPEHIVRAYRALHARLSCLGDLGTERALCSFSDREVRRIASAIVDLNVDIQTAIEGMRR